MLLQTATDLKGPRILFLRATDVQSARHINTLVTDLADRGFETSIAIFHSNAGPPLDFGPRTHIHYLNAPQNHGLSRLKSQLGLALRLRALLAAAPHEILYIIDSWSLLPVWLATLGRFRTRNKVLVYHTFDWLEPRLVSRVHTALERAVCGRADLVVNTDRSRARLQQTLYGLSRCPLWIQNCLPQSTPLPPADPELRRRLLGPNVRGDECLIAYPTTVWDEASAQRQLHELLCALGSLPGKCRLLTFFKEGSEYRRCLACVREQKLDTRVRFLPPLPFNELRNHLAVADIGAILYDDRRSSGYYLSNADKLSVLISCGLPYIASDYPNLESVTCRHSLGVCCDSHSADSIVMAINQLTEGKVPLPARKRHVRQVFEKELHYEPHGARLAAELRARLTERSRGISGGDEI